MNTHHHEELIGELAKEYADLLAHSKQAIYIYLDDTHKICNKKFSDLLGYSSPQVWGAITTNFPETFVVAKSQMKLVLAYQEAMEKFAGSTFSVTWKKKNGKSVDTQVILVPIVFSGHAFALHFISEK